MKISNNDVKKITEIKQYFLDPPVSFRLYDYAITYVREAIAILNKYSPANEVTEHLKNLLRQLETKLITQGDLRSVLKDAGVKISRLTSK